MSLASSNLKFHSYVFFNATHSITWIYCSAAFHACDGVMISLMCVKNVNFLISQLTTCQRVMKSHWEAKIRRIESRNSWLN
jgi:hypothetical protein